MNKIMLIGRLTADPDIRIKGQTQWAKFSLAVDRRFKKEGAPDADFFNCVAFGKLAELLNMYVFKGSKIAITGEMNQDNYTDKEGNKKYSWQVVVSEMDFCESKKPTPEQAQEPAQAPDPDGFMQLPEGEQEELPFM